VLRVPANASDAERQAVRHKLLELRQKIVSNQLDFAEAARKHSECPSAPQGGDLGRFERKFDVDEAFARAAFALKVGEVSDVVPTDFGLHLIKVTERTPAKPSDFVKVKEQVTEMYDLELRMAIITQQRQKAKIEVNLP
jgi:parvulin-like peptidyl-prolyl isomerase